ncbi:MULTISPECIES: hypothetical protein [unclassified Synechococcus]|uniref:hypothetical protein n=1 Tax=unclassified Synechococcus TaxID=2626047 RepID=UPI0016458880|nr:MULTISPECIES: hypothetical protein [unclassified Synechococcus]MEC7248376.1 hypothetical protein [Cyanobacteriota bacterium]MEC7896576.1 hypothetical protein [Cyanobacteriota bacterium]
MSFRSVLPMACATAVTLCSLPLAAAPQKEMPEQDFLDQVEVPGHVLVTAKGVAAVDAEARRQGLRFPAVGYWSPETICFQTPPTDDCNGLFLR